MNLFGHITAILYKLSLTKPIKTALIFIASITLMWLMLFHWTGVHEVGICRNIFTGELSIDSVSGFEITAPWVQVSMIDTRPQRLCVECDCRSLSCKLVEFKSEHWRDFVDNEGFGYYWWANRFSFNSGADEEYRGMRWILRGYAFSGQEHTFIKTTKE